jgi:hypothetical protein
LVTRSACPVAGGIIGVRDGVAAIPSRWRNALRGRDHIDALIEATVSRDASQGETAAISP